jgi:hypothetical protein
MVFSFIVESSFSPSVVELLPSEIENKFRQLHIFNQAELNRS